MATKTLAEILHSQLAPEALEAIDIERKLAALSVKARQIADTSGYTRRDIARRMGLESPSQVQRIISNGAAYNASVETLARFASACGYDLAVDFERKASAGEFTAVMEFLQERRASYSSHEQTHERKRDSNQEETKCALQTGAA
jgi:transcriptional regulator with XRE-family HTH domain